MLMLQWASQYGFADFLNQLESLGFFQYILPFLLIFAVVYAVLTKIKVFEENKGASVVIAIAIGLLALQFDILPAFFQNIFPKFGIGLAILLIGLILAGAFISGYEKAYSWIFFGIGGLIFLIIIFISLADIQFAGSWWWTYFWDRYGAATVALIIVAATIVGIILATRKREG